MANLSDMQANLRDIQSSQNVILAHFHVVWHTVRCEVCNLQMPYTGEYRDLLTVLPMREPSIFRGIAVSLLRPVIGSNVEIDVVALNWVADVRKQIAAAFK